MAVRSVSNVCGMLLSVSIFEFYRRLLAIVTACYVVVRAGSLFWRWQVGGRSADSRETVLRRYFVTLLLRGRARRFFPDFLQIGILVAVLGYVLYLHY